MQTGHRGPQRQHQRTPRRRPARQQRGTGEHPRQAHCGHALDGPRRRHRTTPQVRHGHHRGQPHAQPQHACQCIATHSRRGAVEHHRKPKRAPRLVLQPRKEQRCRVHHFRRGMAPKRHASHEPFTQPGRVTGRQQPARLTFERYEEYQHVPGEQRGITRQHVTQPRHLQGHQQQQRPRPAGGWVVQRCLPCRRRVGHARGRGCEHIAEADGAPPTGALATRGMLRGVCRTCIFWFLRRFTGSGVPSWKTLEHP